MMSWCFYSFRVNRPFFVLTYGDLGVMPYLYGRQDVTAL